MGLAGQTNLCLYLHVLTVGHGSKLQHEVESSKDYVGLDQLIAVQFSEELHSSKPPLVHLGDVELQT